MNNDKMVKWIKDNINASLERTKMLLDHGNECIRQHGRREAFYEVLSWIEPDNTDNEDKED